MDQNRLDSVTRALRRGVSRRTVLNRFAGASALASLAVAKEITPAFALSESASVGSTSEGEVLMVQATPTAETAPTVVLVHGAFADAGSWAGVVMALQAAGVKVQAAANPLRSVSGDAAYIASVVNQIPGPVLLVGHSYGGAVISVAAPRPRMWWGWSTSPPSFRTRGRRCNRWPSRPQIACLAQHCSRPIPDGRGGRAGRGASRRPG